MAFLTGLISYLSAVGSFSLAFDQRQEVGEETEGKVMAEKLPGDDSGMIVDTRHPDDIAHEIIVKEKLPPRKQAFEIHPAGGDTCYWVEDVAKWIAIGTGNFLAGYIDNSDPYHEVERTRPMYVDAVEKAKEWFAERGARPLGFADDAIEIHLHPRTSQIVWIFKWMLNGKPAECGIPYILSRDQIGWLKATNRWPKGPTRDQMN